MSDPFAHPIVAAVLLLAPVGVPIAILLSFLASREHRIAEVLTPWAPLPAVVLAMTAPVGVRAEVPWLMLGVELTLDETGRMFLFFLALVWLVAGQYARGYMVKDARRGSFHGYHLTAMAGTLGLPVAADMASFYLLFALMTFSAHGLIIHTRSKHALRAGTTYLVLAVLGEGMLLSAVLLTVGSMDTLLLADVPPAIMRSGHTRSIVLLFLGGFGVKAALLPFHPWLPLAHPVAPTPASATLSGAMIKAGLLGWLRFLPLGEPELAAWGGVVVALGFAGAYFGVLAGLGQRDPKTVLAYSSISQMGLMIVIVGAALASPEGAEAAAAAASIFALHHGMAKASLFLSVGMITSRLRPVAGRLVIVGVAIAVLALAGAPATSGAVAKKALGSVIDAAPGGFASAMALLASLASTATLLLLLRFAWVARAHAGRKPPVPASVAVAWCASVVATAGLVWVVPWAGTPELVRRSLAAHELWASTWPVLLALALAGGVTLIGRRSTLRLPSLPVGDLLVVLEHAYMRLRPRLATHARTIRDTEHRLKTRAAQGASSALARSRALLDLERALSSWTIGVLLLVVASVVAFASMFWS